MGSFPILIGVVASIVTIAIGVLTIVRMHPNVQDIRKIWGITGGIVVLILLGTLFISAITSNLAKSSTDNSSPTQTTLPKSTPAFLYWENGSDNWKGWIGTTDWKIFNGMLLNDGTNYCCGSQPTITAPYQVQGVANYAVEVKIKVISYPADYTACFDITVRGIQMGDVWQGYKVSIGCDGNIEIKATKGTDEVIAHLPFNPEKAWRTYCLEVRDTNIRLFIDGNLTLEKSDDRYLSGGQVGLKSFRTQLSVSSFKVINTCIV